MRERNRLREASKGVGVALLVLAATAGCASAPPKRIQEAIHTLNTYLPEYVRESNKSLAETHPADEERLTGIGDRMVKMADALDRWASGDSSK